MFWKLYGFQKVSKIVSNRLRKINRLQEKVSKVSKFLATKIKKFPYIYILDIYGNFYLLLSD